MGHRHDVDDVNNYWNYCDFIFYGDEAAADAGGGRSVPEQTPQGATRTSRARYWTLCLGMVAACAAESGGERTNGGAQPGATSAPMSTQLPTTTAPTPQTDPTAAAPPTAPLPMMGTAGTTAAPPPQTDTCGADPANPGDGICPGGLACTDPTGTQSYACTCPLSPTSLPPCTMGGTECAVFPGTNCSNLFGTLGCHMSCTPEGVAPPACPDPLTCVDPLMSGVAFCVMAGQILPPVCATQEDCAAYEGTFCMDPLGFGLGCVKSCVVGAP